MNRSLKMFLFVLIAYWILMIPAVLVRNYPEFQQAGTKYAFEYIFIVLFYSIPLVVVSFGLLLWFNLIMKSKAQKDEKRKWNKDYYLVGLLFVLVIPIALIVFECTQRSRYFNDSDFYDRIYGYLFLVGFGFVLLIMNKKLFWKSANRGI